tara:strand:+ start:1021 stop:1434 length:414 start_codon:yes stop_codon:yes gene_type:complete
MRTKQFKNLTALEIGEELKKVLGIDIYENTRQSSYVRARALMCYLLRERLNLRWTTIAKIFNSQGKSINHTGVFHLVKMYSTYKREDPTLIKLEQRFVFTKKVGKEFDYSKYLESKYDVLEEKYYKLEKKYLDLIQK